MSENKNTEPYIAKGIYKHYKGNLYKVIGTATHSETLEKLVVYTPMYGDAAGRSEINGANIWVRPLKMFFESIEVNGKKTLRFEFIG